MMSVSRRIFLRGAAGAASLAAIPVGAEMIRLLPSEAKSSLADDPLRPQYHLLPAKNWMNDPNGPVYWKGKHHMFFQYNPNDAVWGDMHWNHAVSEDMIHWKHLPVAIAPTPGGPDQDGVFSGTAFVQDGRVGMMYTGVKKSSLREATIKASSLRETQCLAMANDDDLSSFTKVPQPVIPSPPENLQVNGFRDPSPWKQGEWWYTPIASGIANEGGAILLYRSRDLRSWEFVKIFAQREPSFEAFQPWDVWECPEFFALGDRHVLIFSTMGKAFWQAGHFDAEKLEFHPERMGILDYGSYYAPKTQLDAAGNRILWGWVQETGPEAEYKAAGWAGMMSLPRVLSMAPDGALRYAVANAARNLRSDERRFMGVDGNVIKMAGCCGEALYRANRHQGQFTLEIQGDRDKATWITIAFDPAHADEILVDAQPLKLTLAENEGLDIHLYLDSSVMELIVNNQVAWTKRFYYGGAAQDAILRWQGKDESLESLSSWRLNAISPNRLTG